MFKHILAPLDGSQLAEGALPHVATLAQAYESYVTLLHVLHPKEMVADGYPVDPLNWHMQKAEIHAYLKEQAVRLESLGIDADVAVAEGIAAELIIDFIARRDVDLVVLSDHGQSGLSRWNVSSVVHKVMHGAPISTLIVRARRSMANELDKSQYSRILVPLDGSQRAECVLPPVVQLARRQNCRITFAHVINEPPLLHRAPLTLDDRELIERFVERNQQAASAYLEDVRARCDVPSEKCLLVGVDVSSELHILVDERQMDLVVLSAHGRTGNAERPHGGLATSFIEYGSTPLLIVQDLDIGELKTAYQAAIGEETSWERVRPLTYAQ